MPVGTLENARPITVSSDENRAIVGEALDNFIAGIKDMWTRFKDSFYINSKNARYTKDDITSDFWQGALGLASVVVCVYIAYSVVNRTISKPSIELSQIVTSSIDSAEQRQTI